MGYTCLTHWGRAKWPHFANSIFLNENVWILSRFHWSVFPGVQLTTSWFRWWLGIDQATGNEPQSGQWTRHGGKTNRQIETNITPTPNNFYFNNYCQIPQGTMSLFIDCWEMGLCNFQLVIFKLIPWIDTSSISCKLALNWMPKHLNNEKSTWVQVMAWCRQATNHYLRQCWPKPMSPYGITKAQWVKD